MGEETLPYEVVGKGVERGVESISNGEVNTPRKSHQKWLADRTADGWTYGLVKDAEKKTHPAMVEYLKLPSEQRAKDTLFFSIVEALLPYV